MSVWVLRQNAGSAEAEAALTRQNTVAMPWVDLPDLSAVHSQPQLRALIAALMPAAPPETVTLRTELVWSGFSRLEKEDLIAIPLPHSGKVAFAEITGHYAYSPPSLGRAGQHVYEVRWFNRQTPLAKFGKRQSALLDDSMKLWEVQGKELRDAIRNQLPLGYNRFRHLTWILGIGFLFQLIRMLHPQ